MKVRFCWTSEIEIWTSSRAVFGSIFAKEGSESRTKTQQKIDKSAPNRKDPYSKPAAGRKAESVYVYSVPVFPLPPVLCHSVRHRHLLAFMQRSACTLWFSSIKRPVVTTASRFAWSWSTWEQSTEREREKTATSAPGTYAIASKGSKPEPRSRGSLGSPTPERMFLIALTRLRKNNANLPELQTQGIFRRPRFGPTCKLNSAQRIQRPQQPKNRTRVGGRPHDTANYSNTTSQQRGFGKCSSERPAPSTLFPFPCKLPRPPDGLPG